MIKRLFFIIVAVLLTANISSRAFDGQRKGFILGGGLGFGLSRIDSETEKLSRIVWRGAPAFELRFGYAANNRTVLFMGTKIVLTYYYDIFLLGGTHTTLSFFGITYYFSDQTPSFLLDGSLGMGFIPNDISTTEGNGFGLSLAGGYEFSRHLDVHLNLIYGSAQEGTETFYVSDYEKSKALSIMITFNVTAY